MATRATKPIHHSPYESLPVTLPYIIRVDSRFAPSQWETLLQSNAVSHWLGANLESALHNPSTGASFPSISPPLQKALHRTLDSFTVSLHNPNSRQIACRWGCVRWLSVVFKMFKFPPITWTLNPLCLRQSQPIFRPTNHKRMMPVNQPASHVSYPTDSPTATRWQSV